MKNKSFFILYILVFGLITSCGDHYVYDQEIEIPEDKWTYNNPIDFEFVVEDTTQLYNLYIEVKHHKDYPNQNAYAKLNILFPDGSEKDREVSFELASAEGDWVGKCSGDYCRTKLVYNGNEPMRFQQLGTYKLHFEQYTRQDSLEGISSLRLMLEEAKLEETKE